MFYRAFSDFRGALGVIAACAILGAPLAQADDAWIGKGEAGFLLSRGNADATSANAKLDISRESGDWKNSAYLSFLYGKNESFATAQRLEERWETDYKLTERMFVFGALHGEEDEFSGFVYQATVATGVGYKFFDSDRTKLAVTLGAGYRRLQSELLVKNADGEVTERIKGDTVGNGVGNAGLDYMHKLTSNTKVVDKLLIESGSENTSIANDLSLQVNMSQTLALSAGYGVRFNSNPPAGSKTTDELTTINLVYSFKKPT